jgi:peptide/nickel transport system permease protein
VSAQRVGASHFTLARRALLRDRAAMAAAAVLALIVLGVILAPWISPHDPLATNPRLRLTPPLTGGFLLGSDELGRDILSRLAYGGRSALLVALVPVVIAITIGSALGLAGGYFRGLVDTVVMRVMDVLLAFPSVLLAIGITAALGPSATNLIIALVIVAVPSVARIIRASVLQVGEAEFVSAARAIGASHRRIAMSHILPNVLSPVIVFASLEVGRMIILASGLSFLGLGAQPPAADWGAMLATGRQFMTVAPHVATVPGVVIFVVTLSMNVLGDGLRDALDPRMSAR